MRVLGLVVIILVSNTQAAGDGSVEARWRREYPPAAERLEHAIQTFAAAGRSSTHFKSGVTRKTESLTIAASGGRRVIRSESRSEQKTGAAGFTPDGSMVGCETPEYVFTLSRPYKSTTYTIDEYGPNPGNPESSLDFRIGRSAIAYLGFTLLSRIQDPTFELQSADEVSLDGRSLIRIMYKGKVGRSEESGTVHLDPSLGWVIRAADVRFHDANGDELNLQEHADYATTDPAPFLPSRFEWTLKTPNPDRFERRIVEFDDIRAGEPPDELFRLSGYGLPDIPLSPQPGRSFYTWNNPLFWASLSAALVSFVLLRSIKWRPRSQTT